MRIALPALAAAALATSALVAPDRASAQVDETFETEHGVIQVQTFADGLENPWGLAFMTDGSMLVTERPGQLRWVSAEGEVSEPIEGVPEVDAREQGGLLDVVLHPEFDENRLVYLSYAEEGEGGTGTAVARGTLNEDGTALEDVEVIFQRTPKIESAKHFGSRLVFSEGHLYVTLGEGSDEEFRTQSQDLDSHLGKVVRLNDDGSVPEDNPFVDDENALDEIWSYGHRNPQGMALHPETGIIWINDHGPRGGDMINIPQAGLNYGWPVATYGVEYSGEEIMEGDEWPEGMEEPLHQWTPSPGVSGMDFYYGDQFPEWQGNAFIGALALTKLIRVELDGESVVDEEDLLEDLGLRIRAVKVGGDGALYLLTDETNGEILRVSAAEGTATGTVGDGDAMEDDAGMQGDAEGDEAMPDAAQ